MTNHVEVVFSMICTGITYLIGGADMAIYSLALFMAIDFITGVMVGYKTKTLTRDKSRDGLLKKATIILVLIVAVTLDRLLNNGMWVFRTLIAYFYICSEGLSILENSAKIGIPVPQKLVDALANIKTKGDGL